MTFSLKVVVIFMLFMLNVKAVLFAKSTLIDFIQYRFVDASVPPEYHRSFTITATPTQWRLIEDSYGKILSDTSRPLSESKWNKILEAYKESKLRSGTNIESNGCTGGTQIRVDVKSGEKVLSKLHRYRCQKNFGNLRGNPEILEAVLKKP